METKPLVMERTYNAPVTKVWEALTDAAKMRQWYFDIKAFEPEVGYEFSFLCDCDGEEYLHICKVTDVVPGHKLTYSWRYGGYEGMSYVTFELFTEGEGTRLVLTHTGLETFPLLKNFTRESFTGGWIELIGDSLKEFVERK
jgi:uncharacterized protein YndB with AHSA1/START domain